VARAVESAPGEWLVAQATYGQDLPDKAELDAVTGSTPTVLRWSMHMLQANTAALERAGIDRMTTPPVQSRIEFDDDGEPTGFVEEGFDLFPIPMPDEEALAEILAADVQEAFVEKGVTTIYELPASAAAVRAWQALAASGKLPLRLTLNPISEPGHQPILRSADDLARVGFATGFGSDSLKLGAVKLFLDGDEKAAFYCEQLHGTPRKWGLVTHTYNELVGTLALSFRSGLQVWIHAIGDAAQAMILDAIEDVVRRHPDLDHRTRIEHIGNECSDPTQVERMVRAKIVPVPTAAFMYGTPPADGATRYYLFRTLIDAGLKPPGNSDTAGTQPFATNPWFSIDRMLNRTNKHGEEVSPEERVTLREALAVHTEYGAYAAFEEDEKGSLEIGKLGDLVVLDRDPFTTDPEQIGDVQTDITVIGGTVAYERVPSTIAR
jgi:predicted amidohydrolase YtcJ